MAGEVIVAASLLPSVLSRVLPFQEVLRAPVSHIGAVLGPSLFWHESVVNLQDLKSILTPLQHRL